MKSGNKPVAQPPHQGFSLKKWAPPIFQGKSPGDEVAHGLVSSSFITHSLFCSHSSFSRFQCSVPVTRLSVKSLSDGHLWDGSWPGFYLGFMVWRSPEWPKATSFLGRFTSMLPRKFLEMSMPWDAIWCILRHNFEKCYSVCTDLVASG